MGGRLLLTGIKMVSTDTYILDISKKDNTKVVRIMNKFPASHLAIIDKESSSSMIRYEIAISQKALNDLDKKLKRLDIDRKFTLL